MSGTLGYIPPANGASGEAGVPFPPMVPGADLSGLTTTQRLGAALTVTAGRPYVHLALIPEDISITDLSVIVTTGAASAVAQLGVYANTASFGIGARLAVTASLDCSTSGTKTGAAATSLDAGYYWIASLFTGGAPSVRQISGVGIPIGTVLNDHVIPGRGYDTGTFASLPANGSSFTALSLSDNNAIPVTTFGVAA